MTRVTHIQILTDIDAGIEQTLALIAMNPEGNARVYAEMHLTDLKARRTLLRCLMPQFTVDRHAQPA